MEIVQIISQIDWNTEKNKRVSETLVADAIEYMKRVEAHIYKGNEIRADMYMDFAEKQDEISRLDRKRTEAHNRMLNSVVPFLDVLRESADFKESDYKLSNRTQIADFIAEIAFEVLGLKPSSRIEGCIRDELAERLHKGEITYEQINEALHKLMA